LPYVNKDDLVSKDALDIHRLRMPQIDSIFFNRDSSNKALKELSVRKALAYSLSKDEIVSSVLAGDAEVASEPFVRFSFAFQEGEDKYGFDLTKAKEALEAGKWLDFIVSEEDISAIKAKQTAILEKTVASSTKEEGEIEKLSAEEEMKISLGAGTWRARGEDGSREYLFVNLTTIEDDRQIRTVEKIKEQWEKIGIKTNLIFSPVGQEQAEMIETRNFEALFYSQFLGSDPDSYVFWHSTQAGKNGLNLSNYANDKVDETLEEARATSSLEVRVEKYKKFQELIMEDVPAIFVYSPLYIYVQNKKIKGFSGDAIIDPSDRFAGLSSWYIKTGKKLIW
jgi:peptide/nickel transport system substrate-binding protein